MCVRPGHQPLHLLLLKDGEHGVFDAFSYHCAFCVHRGKNSRKTILHLAASTTQERNRGQLRSSVSQPVMCLCESVPQTTLPSVTERLDPGCWGDMRNDLSACCAHGGQTDTDRHICTAADMELKRVPHHVSTGAKRMLLT